MAMHIHLKRTEVEFFFLLNPWNTLHQNIICLIGKPVICDIHHQKTLPVMIHNGMWCVRGNPF